MFTLPMMESQHKCRVVVKDTEHKHLVVVLDYLYSGWVLPPLYTDTPFAYNRADSRLAPARDALVYVHSSLILPR